MWGKTHEEAVSLWLTTVLPASSSGGYILLIVYIQASVLRDSGKYVTLRVAKMERKPEGKSTLSLAQGLIVDESIQYTHPLSKIV